MLVFIITPLQLFYGPFSGTTRVSRCQKKASSGLCGAREDKQEADTLTIQVGVTPSGPGQQSTSINAQFLRQMPFLSQPSKSILA